MSILGERDVSGVVGKLRRSVIAFDFPIVRRSIAHELVFADDVEIAHKFAVNEAHRVALDGSTRSPFSDGSDRSQAGNGDEEEEDFRESFHARSISRSVTEFK